MRVPGQEGGGVWGRAIGGDIKTRTTSTTTNVGDRRSAAGRHHYL